MHSRILQAGSRQAILACALATLALAGLCASALAQGSGQNDAEQKRELARWRKAWKAKWLQEHPPKKANADPLGQDTSAQPTTPTAEKKPPVKAAASEKPARTHSVSANVTKTKPAAAKSDAAQTAVKKSAAVTAASQPAVTKPTVTKPTVTKSALTQRPAPPAAKKPALAQPAAAMSVPAAAKKTEALYSQAKPDIVLPTASREDRPRDSPLSAIGDSGRLILYLIPTLLLIVGGLRLLRNYQERTGRLPAAVDRFTHAAVGTSGRRGSLPTQRSGGVMQALFGSFHLNKARQRAGSNIHLVESLPLGGANLHLVEVRGRLLLLGATGMNLSLLSEFSAEPEADVFQEQLRAAAADLDSLGLEGAELPMGIVVGALDEVMHDTRGLLEDRTRRLRAIQQGEDTYA